MALGVRSPQPMHRREHGAGSTFARTGAGERAKSALAFHVVQLLRQHSRSYCQEVCQPGHINLE
jgi:hypothetical protein